MQERIRLLSYYRVLVFDEHAAEDVLQDVALAAIAKSDEIESEAHLMGWLRSAGRLRALELCRNRGRHADVLANDVLDLIDQAWAKCDPPWACEDHKDALRKCLEKLSPSAKELIRHRYADGLTGQRLAERLGKKLNSTYVAVSRVHKTLHLCMQKSLDDSPLKYKGVR